jgi:uncharacterized membrane protein YgdD (TMEM256/DUF423 family)
MSASLNANSRRFIIIAGISGFIMVVLGAFGGHALKEILSAEQLGIWDVAVKYQMVHTVALLAIALLMMVKQNKILSWAAWAFVEGIVLFSGSLYLLAYLDVSWLGMITPFGGLAFLLGWLLLIVGVAKKGNE